MNEIDFIRAQLATERRHLDEVEKVLRAVLERAGQNPPDDETPFGEICTLCRDYLKRASERFNERDRADREALRALVAQRDLEGMSVLRSLEVALAANTTSGDNSIDRQQLERVRERLYGVDEWRRTSFIDADWIMSERTQYGRIQSLLRSSVAPGSADSLGSSQP